MKKILLLLLLTVNTAAFALTITPEKQDHYRKTGDEVIFNIQLDPGRKDIFVPVEIDGNRDIRRTVRVLADASGKAKISVPALRSGFIYVRVKDNNQSAAAGVAVDPGNIRPDREIPESFRKYWDNVKKEFNTNPVRYEISEIPNPKAGFKAWDVKLLLPGKESEAYCILTMPADAAAGRCAAKVVYQPAGVDQIKPVYTHQTITLNVNPLPIKHNGAPMSQTIKPEGKFFRYWNWGPDDLTKNCFPSMIKRAYRALQFVKTLPEWDQRTLIVYGRSQGGAQALAAAGLDPQVTMVAAFVPALCNHGGFAAGNQSGWPSYFRMPEYKNDPEKSLAVTDIIDVTFFAQSITNAEVIVSSGFIDTTCPPASVYAAFNAIPSKNKSMIDDVKSTHSTPAATYSKAEKKIKEHIRKMQTSFR